MDAVAAVQQSGACKGVVKDATGEPIIGASVVVKGTTNGAITDLDGNFTLPKVKKGDILQFSYLGCQTVEVAWDGKPLDITLKEDSQVLGEVVVTA
ncbi:MAG: carboxypeptidase-like regulatory domain-containing protein, partial [Prevotella sp.]